MSWLVLAGIGLIAAIAAQLEDGTSFSGYAAFCISASWIILVAHAALFFSVRLVYKQLIRCLSDPKKNLCNNGDVPQLYNIISIIVLLLFKLILDLILSPLVVLIGDQRRFRFNLGKV